MKPRTELLLCSGFFFLGGLLLYPIVQSDEVLAPISILLGGLKDTVAAVLAAAHNEIGDDGLLVVGGAAQDDAPAGVGVVL